MENMFVSVEVHLGLRAERLAFVRGMDDALLLEILACESTTSCHGSNRSGRAQSLARHNLLIEILD